MIKPPGAATPGGFALLGVMVSLSTDIISYAAGKFKYGRLGKFDAAERHIQKEPHHCGSFRWTSAGVPGSCVSRVTPVNAIGVWSVRNLPPRSPTLFYTNYSITIHFCKVQFYF